MREERCAYNAPLIATPPIGSQFGYLSQLCCNHWDCPRCGTMRAAHEYGRIIEGARKLAQQSELYMITITCTGNATKQSALEGYLIWTNRLLTNLRIRAKKEDELWAYAQVVELQPKRLLPHSHFITTFAPSDAFPVLDNYARYKAEVRALNAKIPPEMRYTALKRSKFEKSSLYSPWLWKTAAKVGLGVQTALSQIDTVEGASRYVAKYLFKSLTAQKFPAKWRRVRYSQSFPKLPEAHDDRKFPIVRPDDWVRLRAWEVTWLTFNPYAAQEARDHLVDVVFIHKTDVE